MTIFFAWVEKHEKFNPDIHEREDEKIFNMKITQKEGSSAIAQIQVLNPKIGLLKANRHKNCYISYRDKQKNHLLFKGSLLGCPLKIDGELAYLHFTALPDNYQTKLYKLSKTLKEAPFFDELFVEEGAQDEPVENLEARPALY